MNAQSVCPKSGHHPKELFSQTELGFSASSDSGRRRIVCKERFPPTDCATVGRCSVSPRSAPRWPLGHNWWWWCTIYGVEVWKEQIMIIIVILLIIVTTWPELSNFFIQMFSFMQWWSIQKRESVWLFALGCLLHWAQPFMHHVSSFFLIFVAQLVLT